METLNLLDTLIFSFNTRMKVILHHRNNEGISLITLPIFCIIGIRSILPLGLVDIFKSGGVWSHMRDFIYIKCCAKGFFSEISILDNKWLLKIAKKMRKCVFLFTGLELEIVLEFRPPLFFDFRGGHTSSILSKSCSFLRYAFLELEFIIQNNDF